MKPTPLLALFIALLLPLASANAREATQDFTCSNAHELIPLLDRHTQSTQAQINSSLSLIEELRNDHRGAKRVAHASTLAMTVGGATAGLAAMSATLSYMIVSAPSAYWAFDSSASLLTAFGVTGTGFGISGAGIYGGALALNYVENSPAFDPVDSAYIAARIRRIESESRGSVDIVSIRDNLRELAKLHSQISASKIAQQQGIEKHNPVGLGIDDKDFIRALLVEAEAHLQVYEFEKQYANSIITGIKRQCAQAVSAIRNEKINATSIKQKSPSLVKGDGNTHFTADQGI